MDLDKTLVERVAEREEKRRRQEEQRQLQEQLGEHVLPQPLTDWRDWKSVYSKFDHVDIAIEMHGLIAGVRHNQYRLFLYYFQIEFLATQVTA